MNIILKTKTTYLQGPFNLQWISPGIVNTNKEQQDPPNKEIRLTIPGHTKATVQVTRIIEEAIMTYLVYDFEFLFSSLSLLLYIYSITLIIYSFNGFPRTQ